MFDVTKRAKPVLKWAGGKSGLLAQMLPQFPKQFERYVEPFLGGGAVFLSLQKGVPALLGEQNPELANMYKVVRDNPEELTDALDALRKLYSEEHFYALRAARPRSAVKKAARTIYLNKTGFNGLYRQNSKGEFNVPFGKRVRCPDLYNRKNLFDVSARLQTANLVNSDFESILLQCGKGDFVYCDPPYEPLSSTSSFNAYVGSGFSASDQERLRNACVQAVKRGAIVAVSNSSAPLILKLYQEWDVREVLARRAINSRATARGAIPEVLVLMGG